MANSAVFVGIIRSALRGIRAVFKSESGNTRMGVPSPYPWIFLSVMPPSEFACERCRTVTPIPDPPCGQGMATGPRTPLFGKDSVEYAQFVSVKFHEFIAAHKGCAKEEEEES